MKIKLPPVLVINRISTLRRVTAAALRAIGFSDIRQASDEAEASEEMERMGSELLIIQELSLRQYYQAEFDFLDRLRHFQSHQQIFAIVTSQEADKDLIDALSRIKIRELVIKSIDIDEFSARLDEAVHRLIFPYNTPLPAVISTEG